ncbi:MAG: ATP-grasp fold amidoligase family protein [Muricoprocola sp.]
MKNIIKYIKNPYRVFASLSSKGKLLWMDEKVAVPLIYHGKVGEKLDLHNPVTFNEKLQWLKVYDHNPLYTKLVDKHEVRKYVEQWLGKEYLIPEIGIWESPEEIDFSILPSQFVIKCTHDSGSTIVCRNKDNLNKEDVIAQLNQRMRKSHYWIGREWPYKNVKPRIIAEKFMGVEQESRLTDYKFYCFNGEPKFLYISIGLENHETAQISFFDLNGKLMPFARADFRRLEIELEMPSKFKEMIEIARKCAKQVASDFLRVDLYQINGQIYFSEFTFTPCSGYMEFVPKEYDRIIGDMLKLNKKECIYD